MVTVPQIDTTPSPKNHHCANCRIMAAEACSLMRLPVEIRLVIYQYLFNNSDPIKLDINNAGYISFTDQAKLHLPSLRTSKTFYIEACPLLYGINTFTITSKDVHRLLKMRQGSRLCIENLIVQPERPMEPPQLHRNPVQPPIVALPVALNVPPNEAPQTQTNPPLREVLELGSIGNALGGLQNLFVNPSDASTFLATVLQLSMNLPCSPIRNWPVLKVIVHVMEYAAGDYEPGVGLCLTEKHQKLIKAKPRLSALKEASNLGLGQEMPDLKTIHVNGHLSRDQCQLIEDHKSSFGDCSFEKEIIHSLIARDDKVSKYKYTWRRVDDDEQQAKARNAAVNMSQWVPRLSEEDYRKVLASFGAGLEAVQYPMPQKAGA